MEIVAEVWQIQVLPFGSSLWNLRKYFQSAIS